jgi:hypothetical protein
MMERVREIAHLLRTQDNRITDQPIFMVQRNVPEWNIEEGFEEGAVWCDDEGPVTNEETVELLESGAAELDDGEYRKVGYRDRWENVQPFFTEEGAKEHLRINGHNLGKTRIYAEGSFRNAEWRFMRELILALVPSEKAGEL